MGTGEEFVEAGQGRGRRCDRVQWVLGVTWVQREVRA